MDKGLVALLLDLLNSTPVVDGRPTDLIADEEAGRRWLTAHGRPGTAGEWRTLTEARAALQTVVRGDRGPAVLAPFLDGVSRRPVVTAEGVEWRLDAPEGRTTAALAVLAWDEVRLSSPGRLRPCANPDCRLFLLDRSKPNTARWCSMAACGNRMKARRHHERGRSGTEG